MHLPWVDKANRIFSGVLVAQFVISLFIAYFTSTWLEALMVGLPTLLLPLFLISQQGQAPLTRYTVGVAIQLFTALHIQQAYGMTELHFEVFVMLAFLAFYRDWKVIACSVAFVAVHHISFYIFQSMETGLVIFEEGNLMFYILLIHAGFALTEAALLMFVAKESYNEAQASLVLSSSVDQILCKDGRFDLSLKLDDSNPELKSFNQLIRAFSDFIRQAKGVTADVADASDKAADLAVNVDSATQHNAAQIEQIVTATDEMVEANHDVANRTNNVNDLAESVSSSTVKAKDIISSSQNDMSSLRTTLGSASDTIGELASKCNQIEEVMSAIKSISEQTNLLALNAAIESARAGDHGRGFAVVADEVRQLAMRTGENAEQISDITTSLIADADKSVEQMEGCVDKAVKAAESSDNAQKIIEDVAEAIGSVTDNTASVATAAEEQSAVSSSISDSTKELSINSDRLNEYASEAGNSFAKLKTDIDVLNRELSRFAV